VSKGLTNNTVE